MTSALEIEALSFSYPDGTAALKDITLRIEAGERVAIIGPNGAGKSTLFFHLNGTFQGSGLIRVFGEVLTPASVYTVRQLVGLVFQDPNDQLFMPSVFEDVAFGPQNLGLNESEVRTRVSEALEEVGMSGAESRVPHHLSLGERKKIAMAAVLSLRPKLLAIDEPSSGLDPRSRRALMEFLISQPQSQLIATHDLDLVLDVCHRAILLDRGRVVADEPVPGIFADGARLEAHGLETPWRLRKSPSK